jgi:hypothetical protein
MYLNIEQLTKLAASNRVQAILNEIRGLWNPNAGKALYGERVARNVREKGMTFVEPAWESGTEHPTITTGENLLKSKNDIASHIGESVLSNVISPTLLEKALKRKTIVNPDRGSLSGVARRIKNRGFVFNQNPTDPLPSALKGVQSNRWSATDMALFNRLEADKQFESTQFKEIGKTLKLKNIIKQIGSRSPQKLHAALSKMYPQGYVAKLQDGAASLGGIGTAEQNIAIPNLGYHLKDVNPSNYKNMVVQPDKQLKNVNPLMYKLQSKLLPDVESSKSQEFRVHVVNGKVVPYGTLYRGNMLQHGLSQLLPFRTPNTRMVDNYAQKVIDNVKNPRLRKGIYGFDVGIDMHGKPQLLETNPSGVTGSSGWMAADGMPAVMAAIEGKLPTHIKLKRLAYGGAGLLGTGAAINKFNGNSNNNTKIAKSMELKELIKAKKMSDQSDYIHKNEVLRRLLVKNPEAFKVDSYLNGSYVGLTHLKSGFKIHAPRSIVPSSLIHPNLGVE